LAWRVGTFVLGDKNLKVLGKTDKLSLNDGTANSNIKQQRPPSNNETYYAVIDRKSLVLNGLLIIFEKQITWNNEVDIHRSNYSRQLLKTNIQFLNCLN
jgi:hypothetical protein